MRGPGHMGNEQVTIQNLQVIQVDIENNLLIVEGAVPGAKNNTVRISHSLKKGTDKELKVTAGKGEETTEEAPQTNIADAAPVTDEAPAENAEKAAEHDAEVPSENDTNQDDK
jgi:large subunit ribosomal protein L3